MGRIRTRARLAIVACVLWLAGVEVVPAIHEGLHASLAPHRHDAGGMVVTVYYGEPTHRHPDGTMHYADPGAPPAKRPVRDRRSRVAAGDHADGLAHHATALIATALPLTQPLPVDRRPRLVVISAAQDPVLLAALSPSARGPPRAS